MGLNVMLTVDLNKKTTSKQRTTFNKELAKKKWNEIENLTTTWWASFEDNVTERQAVYTTKADVETATKKAGVKNCDVALMVGNSKPPVVGQLDKGGDPLWQNVT